MKSLLFLAGATAAVVATAAIAADAYVPPQIFDARAQAAAYPSAGGADPLQCFNGKAITGANRAGDRALLVQASNSPVYRLELAADCPALATAEKLTVRDSAGYTVCARGPAEVVALTPTGPKLCRVADVRRLTSKEVAAFTARR